MVESFLGSIGSALSGMNSHLFTSSQEKPRTRQPQTLPYSFFKVAPKTYESHDHKIHHGSGLTFAISFSEVVTFLILRTKHLTKATNENLYLALSLRRESIMVGKEQKK